MIQPFNWQPLTRWQRFIRFWSYYMCPWRRCMVCEERFFNPDFWRWSSIKWGIPEYCSKDCADIEFEELSLKGKRHND